MPGHEPMTRMPEHDEVERRFSVALRESIWTRIWHALLDVAACLGYIFK